MIGSTRPRRARRLEHTPLENLLGIGIGVLLTSLGIVILRSAELVTGGTAGFGLLLSYAFDIPVAVAFAGISLPFLALAWWQKGWRFAVKTLATVIALSVVIQLTQTYAGTFELAAPYAALAGNVLAGMGVLATFRHGSSLGGFGIIALVVQDKTGVPAGNVQLILDALVVLASFTVAAPLTVLLSLGGVVVLNLILTLNHRPDRYIAT